MGFLGILLLLIGGASALQTTCKYAALECKNGGFIPEGKCKEGCRGVKWKYGGVECACPKGYSGVDCGVMGAELCTGNTTYHDTHYFNPDNQNKELYCEIERTEKAEFFNLRDNRVSVSVSNEGKSILVTAYSRVFYTPEYKECPECCSDVIALFTCSSTNCVTKKIEGDSKYIASTTCTDISCTTCDAPSSSCIVLKRAVSKPEQIKLDVFIISENETIEADLVLKVPIGTFPLSMSCATGSCMAEKVDYQDHIVVATPPPPIVNKTGLYKLEASNVLIPVIIMLCGCLIFCSSLFYFLRSERGAMKKGWNKKPSASVKDLKEIEMQQYNDKAPLITKQDGDDEATPLVSPPPTANTAPGKVISPTTITKDRIGLAWSNVSFSIHTANGVRKVLNDVSGRLLPGEVIAILGPSGAGKSSLLDILAVRRTGNVSGTFHVLSPYGNKISRKDVCSYVQQYDDMLHTQTVRETLMFSCCLRGRERTADDRDRMVRKVMHHLSIIHIANSKIGNSDIGGISGGERKRVSIGVELVTRPGVLLLDEPTSGLDSHSVDNLMEHLFKVARSGAMAGMDEKSRNEFLLAGGGREFTSGLSATGCPCLMTIHQVTKEWYDRFDRVCLMTRKGEVAYFGEPQEALSYFNTPWDEMASFHKPWEGVLGRGMLSDFTELLDVAQHPDDTRIMQIGDCFRHSKHFESVVTETKAARKSSRSFRETSKRKEASNKAPQDGPLPVRPPRPWWHVDIIHIFRQIYHLSKRQLRHMARDLRLLTIQTLVVLVMAVVMAISYRPLTLDIPGAQNRFGLFFFIVIFFSLISMSALNGFIENRRMFWRERAAGSYNSFVYFNVILWTEIFMFRVLPPIIFGSTVYFVVGLQDNAETFGFFLLVILLASCVASSICLMISGLSPNIATANFVGVVFFMVCMVYSGLLLNNKSSSGLATTLLKLSFMNYAFEALTANELTGLTLKVEGISVDGVYVLGEFFGLDATNLQYNWKMLVAWFFIYSTLGYFSVLLTNRSPKERSICQWLRVKICCEDKKDKSPLSTGSSADLADLEEEEEEEEEEGTGTGAEEEAGAGAGAEVGTGAEEEDALV